MSGSGEAIFTVLDRHHGGVPGFSLESAAPDAWCRRIEIRPVDGALPHWHYVTYGLTELYEKHSSVPEVSGWGHELTFRLERGREEAAPPRWPAIILQSLVDFVYQSRHPFGENHFAPLGFHQGSTLAGATFARDPGVTGTFSSPSGSFFFLQLIGITADELEHTSRVDDGLVVRLLAQADPLLVTRPTRRSVLSPEMLAAVRQVASAPYQSIGASNLIFTRMFTGWWELALDAADARPLAASLESMIPQGQRVVLASSTLTVTFTPAPESGWRRDEQDDLELRVSPPLLREVLAALRAAPGQGASELPSLADFRIRL